MKVNHSKINIIVICILVIIIIIRTWFAFHNDRESLISKYSGRVIELYGVISDDPLVKDFTKTFTFQATDFSVRDAR